MQWKKNSANIDKLRKAWNNKTFGGSVLDPIKAPALLGKVAKKNVKSSGTKENIAQITEKPNGMFNSILSQDNQFCLYACFYNVQMSKRKFIDIKILITSITDAQ